MKTPERKYYFYESGINPENGAIIMDAVTPGLYEARWKRKNRVKQLKRTIARTLAGEDLVPELQTAYRFMRLVMSQERKNADELRFIQGLQLLAKHFSMMAISHMDSVLNKQRKNAQKRAESGQQPDLPPTGGQQDRKEQR